MTKEEKWYWFWAVSGPLNGARKLTDMVEAAGGPEALYNIEETQMREKGWLTDKEEKQWLEYGKERSHIREKYEKMLEDGKIFMVTVKEEEYPALLREIPYPPLALFVKGRLPEDEEDLVAIVGARDCTEYGRVCGERLAGNLAREGIGIVSGLAAGIDSAAHRGALEGGGRTFAVLGCGPDVVYPAGNWRLYERVEESGGLISEYPPGSKPLGWHFPVRNRIISGLSKAVAVMEARKRSGSLITADQALEQGREVFALPGRATDPLSQGCLELLRNGASLLTGSGDILSFLGKKPVKKAEKTEKNNLVLATEQNKVYSCVDFTPRHLEEIVAKTGLSPSRVMVSLLQLELKGYVEETSQNHFIRKAEK